MGWGGSIPRRPLMKRAISGLSRWLPWLRVLDLTTSPNTIVIKPALQGIEGIRYNDDHTACQHLVVRRRRRHANSCKEKPIVQPPLPKPADGGGTPL